MTRVFLRLGLVAATIAGCATNPATGQREISLVSEGQEIAMGEETVKGVHASIGVYPDAELQRYVSALGMRLAAVAERPSLPWSFEVIDDPEINAFAAPGGKIFVTRGILPFMGSEAELAGVLGHEAGHVTARHTARAITRQQLFGIGLIAGSVLSSKIAQAAGGIQAGMQVLFLSYSRGDESQADALGFRYMRRLNYDPREMSLTFATLERVGNLSGGGKVPTWAATHPDPGDRFQKAQQRAATVTADSLRIAAVNRDAFLRVIDGIMFGPNPRQGFFEGSRFLHPDMRFRIDFPQGWQTQNRADAVIGVSPNNDAILQLSLGGNESPEALLQKFVQQQGLQATSSQRTTVHGYPAATAEFTAQDEQGNQLAGRVLYLSYGGSTYQLLGYGTAQAYRQFAGTLQQSIFSFDRLTDQAALNKQPVHLAMVRLSRAMSVAEFYRQYPSPIKIEIIAAINGVEPGGTLPAGTLAKYVR